MDRATAAPLDNTCRRPGNSSSAALPSLAGLCYVGGERKQLATHVYIFDRCSCPCGSSISLAWSSICKMRRICVWVWDVYTDMYIIIKTAKKNKIKRSKFLRDPNCQIMKSLGINISLLIGKTQEGPMDVIGTWDVFTTSNIHIYYFTWNAISFGFLSVCCLEEG